MMESWNSGIMGSGNMQFGLIVKFEFKIKLKLENILYKTNLPLFHYSIVPFRDKFEALETVIFYHLIVEIPIC
jgi:hypothetical protein